MATARPTVTVYDRNNAEAGSAVLPWVFRSPIRPDLVQFVHSNMKRNTIHAHGVKEGAGYQTSAESWGTGRAVARIPRVPGGGTHRAGQGAFGNMCRGGGMFAPIKIWRRWHRKVNVTQKRHAMASAVAATGVPALVMARGHLIESVKELPLVVTNDIESLTKTKQAEEALKKIGLAAELEKVKKSRKIRAGKGKARNRRYVTKRGPLVVYGRDAGIVSAFRNLPGVDLCQVDRINLLKIAPGGSLGRLTVWTESAFNRLDALFGDGETTAPLKKSYKLPRPLMSNADLARIINSDAIQSKVAPAKVLKIAATYAAA